jgi:hypothetical protein
MDDFLKEIQIWYSSECNGDWEHSFGINIQTSDNPGWIVEIDLLETNLADRGDFFHEDRQSEDDWVIIRISNSKFTGSCDPNNLNKVLKDFIFFAKNLTPRG